MRNYCASTLLTAGAGGFSPGLRVAQNVLPTQASEYAHVTRLAGTLGNLLIGAPFGEGQNLPIA